MFVLTVLFQTIAISKPIIPGISWIGSPINILKNFELFGSVINLEFEGKTTYDGEYELPNRVSYIKDGTCSYVSSEFITETYKEFQELRTSKYSIEGSFSIFTGAYSRENEQIKKSIFESDRIVTMITGSCVQYQLNLVRSGTGIQEWFIEELKLLPNNINNEDNIQKWFDIFNYYGTHIITGCDVGGEFYQTSLTKKEYVNEYGKQTTKENAKATLYIELGGTMASSTTIDNKYKSNTVTNSIQITGGLWPNSDDNWEDWIKSIQEFKNIACINWSAREISDIFNWNSELKPLKETAYEALDLYFDKEGCINPSALNYDKYALVNSHCEFKYIPEFRICFKLNNVNVQCQGPSYTCSEWSSKANYNDMRTWTKAFRDDTDNRGGGCRYLWKVEQRDSNVKYNSDSYKYRICFKETEGSSQCQGKRETCSGWNNEPNWTGIFRDDTDNRGGGCKYSWIIEQKKDYTAPYINECRVCFRETEGSVRCKGVRNSCSGWSKTNPTQWTAEFYDDTDDKPGGCKYSWMLECQ